MNPTEKRPERLWRFFRPLAKDGSPNPQLIELLESGRLWFSDILDFNDPFDVLPRFDEFAKAQFTPDKIAEAKMRVFRFFHSADPHAPTRHEFLRNLGPDNPQDFEAMQKEMALKFPTEVRADFAKAFGVVCLSDYWSNESKDDEKILMWSHYAAGHQGVAVELATRDLPFDEQLDPVEYSNNRPHAEPGSPHAEKPCFLRKAECWRYEQEYRLIVHWNQLDRHETPNKSPFAKLPFCAVKRVYLGYLFFQGRNVGAHTTRILRALLQPELANTEVWMMMPSTDSYAVTPALFPKEDLQKKLNEVERIASVK